MKEYPNRGELVLAKVKKIFKHGAFCTLEEYGNKEAFLHISEVAPRWIKNIHEFLDEGKTYVARVIRVDPERGMIDISLKRVSDKEKDRKLEQVKKEKRAYNLVLLACKRSRLRKDKIPQVIEKLKDEYGDLYTAMEEISEFKEEALEGLGLSKGLSKHLIRIAEESIKKPMHRITGILTYISYSPTGIKDIRECLGKIKVPKEEDSEFELIYMGAPKYRINIKIRDYKKGEEILKNVLSQIETCSKNRNVEFRFEREKVK
ncbi:translation initiation factor IF-2 subunit alpha [Candidatus Micrarchaeota archaeon]|nr:translation initiation factor IF-2 subunit alpha [Candidatus Micrarchaeota archaeon]